MSILPTLALACKRAAGVGIFFGRLLNVINQGDAFAGGGELNVSRVALTYLVLFVVSAHR